MIFRYRLLNVFTVDGDRLSGNPLCVFEDARKLNEVQMQALARQFNLSETTFILPPSLSSPNATARVRIFTPTFEMPFAGHPTLGTAHVVQSLFGDQRERVVLEMKVGDVEVVKTPDQDRWKLRTARAPETRTPMASRGELAAMIGLSASCIADDPLWVDTGAEQLIIPLATPDDVRRAKPSAVLLGQHGFTEKRNASMAYVWAPLDADTILARFFFLSNGSVIEDPATGSACANLGGWHLAKKGCGPLPIVRDIHQGEAIGRPSRLQLTIDEERRIFVAGGVVQLATGILEL